ncbi:hypothetical protein [Vibrio mimicus]|uniref:hypothetical protein n=1 Tax=Vibrio mimicus TaxID=674 RepID=UPI0005B62FB0|nr:hypothetical protein [Vibrio mimicus]
MEEASPELKTFLFGPFIASTVFNARILTVYEGCGNDVDVRNLMLMALTMKTGGRVNPQMRSIILNKKCGTKAIDTAFE